MIADRELFLGKTRGENRGQDTIWSQAFGYDVFGKAQVSGLWCRPLKGAQGGKGLRRHPFL
jgi:hypothetical protein